MNFYYVTEFSAPTPTPIKLKKKKSTIYIVPIGLYINFFLIAEQGELRENLENEKYNLQILAEINDPEVRWNFKNGKSK